MKHTVKILLVIAGLVLSSASYAGNGGGHYRGGYYGGGHHGGGHYRGGYYGGGHYGYGSIAGAFIVGGLIGHAITDHRYRQPRTIYRSVYVDKTITNQPTRFFRRENDGNCYLINYRENGDQVATIVPALNCE